MRISTDYTPRPLQSLMHARLQRFNVIVCHRRFGKTVFSINEMLDQALRNMRKDPQYAYIAPTYGQAERIAWDMLKSYTKQIPGVVYNESKLTCTIPRPHYGDRIKIFLLGAENPDSIRGMYLDGAILDEYAEMDPRVWGEVVRHALSDRLGWAIFIGTPKGQNHFHDVYQVAKRNQGKGWYACIHKASDTGVLPDEELMAIRAEVSEEQYNQEMECDFTAALIGSYWGKYLAKAKIQHVPHDPSLVVDTFWDLGINDTTTIWFVQQRGSSVKCIDYIEMSGEGLEYYVKQLKGQGPGAEHRQEYVYRNHEWPHDGKTRDLITGKSRDRAMRDWGVRVNVNEKFDVHETIEAGRRLIPRIEFDEVRCARGIEALKNYQKEWDGKNKIFKDKPLHNWASNGADSFRLLSMTIKPGEDRAKSRKDLPKKCDHEYDVFNY